MKCPHCDKEFEPENSDLETSILLQLRAGRTAHEIAGKIIADTYYKIGFITSVKELGLTFGLPLEQIQKIIRDEGL